MSGAWVGRLGFLLLGVAVVAVRRWRDAGRVPPVQASLDVLALVTSLGLPLAMRAQPDVAGVLQRVMFGVAYAWYVREAVWVVRSRGG